MNKMLDRSITLLGEDNINTLAKKCVCVIGLGGVGGTALIALARSGVRNFVIVDGDTVNESNLNRQLLFFSDDINKTKASAAKNHLLRIDHSLNVVDLSLFINANNINLLNEYKIDYVVDAIDDIPGKISIFEYCKNKNIPFISSLGMGNRLKASDVFITTLDKTSYDPLAKKLRSECRKKGFDLKSIKVAFSREEPIIKSKTPASLIMAPSSSGLNIAGEVIASLIRSE